jgi:hypothetical protein
VLIKGQGYVRKGHCLHEESILTFFFPPAAIKIAWNQVVNSATEMEISECLQKKVLSRNT